MGEYSKRIGEIGEDIVAEYLRLIGWNNAQSGLTLTCTKPEEHKINNGIRKTHGIDYLFSYPSPSIDETLVNAVVSVKYTADDYPEKPLSKFKDFFNDLAWSLECFRHSQLRTDASKGRQGTRNVQNVGVLFWLSNSANNATDIVDKVSGANLGNVKFDAIYFVDNRRLAFIYDSIAFARRSFSSCDIEFHYFSTGKNTNPLTRKQNGLILPVEAINATVLPLRITLHSLSTKLLLISCIEPFSEAGLRRLIGLGQSLSADWAGRIIIAFPDFSQLNHANVVQQVKNSFDDVKSTSMIEVQSFSADFRNIAI